MPKNKTKNEGEIIREGERHTERECEQVAHESAMEARDVLKLRENDNREVDNARVATA